MVVRVHTGGTTLRPASAAFAGFPGRFVDHKGRPCDVLKAMELKYYTDAGRVGDSYLGPEAYPTTRVSTVWLAEPVFDGVDPRPQYETMVFSEIEELDTLDVRYRTRRQAQIGHRKVTRIIARLVCIKAPVVKRHKTRNRR